MKYKNAKEILPKELIDALQDYYQAGYLYIPRRPEDNFQVRRKTDYKVELEKRDQHIYLKYLEGWSNSQITAAYHLSEPSIRRIILKQKRMVLDMCEHVKRIIPKWEIEISHLIQKHKSVWELDHQFMLKVYEDKEQLERNIELLTILHAYGIPVSEIVHSRQGENYCMADGRYYLMTKKLEGSSITNIRDSKLAFQMGSVIGQLHRAFLECEGKIIFWNNSLLEEMTTWVGHDLAKNEWKIIKESDYTYVVEQLRNAYEQLPRQLIHRDVHFGNFLFSEGTFSGYIDFDLSQRNIRIFDICYFLAGLLTKESGIKLDSNEWLQITKNVVDGYESRIKLTPLEKSMLPYVMECIEILCTAYFVSIEDRHCAGDAADIFQYIKSRENEIRNIISE